MQRDSARNGFTLIEISIVMIIISIIAGGVMVGTNLLRSARLRSVMTDQERYVDAVEQFKDRYKALPGDMATATEFWGEEDPDFEACAVLTTPSTTQKTCNGNGNDRIDRMTAADLGGSTYEIFSEYFRLWQHLTNAGLIDGFFTGVNMCGDGTQACYKSGQNAPISDLRNSTWALFDMGALDPLPEYMFTGSEYRHVLYYGNENEWYHMPFGRVLSPKEQWNIDTKFDDGLPGKGYIMSLEPVTVDTWHNRNACATSTNPDTADYNVGNTNLECMMVFRLDF